MMFCDVLKLSNIACNGKSQMFGKRCFIVWPRPSLCLVSDRIKHCLSSIWSLLCKQCLTVWPHRKTSFDMQNILSFGHVTKHCSSNNVCWSRIELLQKIQQQKHGTMNFIYCCLSSNVFSRGQIFRHWLINFKCCQTLFVCCTERQSHGWCLCHMLSCKWNKSVMQSSPTPRIFSPLWST